MEDVENQVQSVPLETIIYYVSSHVICIIHRLSLHGLNTIGNVVCIEHFVESTIKINLKVIYYKKIKTINRKYTQKLE